MHPAQEIDQLVEELRVLTDTCGEPAGTVCRLVLERTDSEIAARIADWIVDLPLSVLFIVVVAVVVSRFLRRGIDRLIERIVAERHERTVAAEELVRTTELPELRLEAIRAVEMEKAAEVRTVSRTRTLGSVLRSAGTIAIWTVAAIMAIAEFGVALGPLVAGAGIAGVALGFGAQSLVKDVLSGIFMLIEDQYGVGDVVDLGEAVGVVEDVQLRITKLRSVDGRLWYVPNGEITRVANLTQLWARAVLDVEVAYDTDLDHAMEVIERTAVELWEEDVDGLTIFERPEVAGVEALGASSVAIRLMVKTEAGDQWAVARELRKRLKRAFDESGIEIPFPQRVVWVRDPDHGVAAD